MRIDGGFRPGFYHSRYSFHHPEHDRLDDAPEHLRIPARRPYFVSGETRDFGSGVRWITLTPLFADEEPRFVTQHPKGHRSCVFERLVDRIVAGLIATEPRRTVSPAISAYLATADLGAPPANCDPMPALPSVFETTLVHTSTLHPGYPTPPDDRVDRLGQIYRFDSAPDRRAEEDDDRPRPGRRYRVVEQWWAPTSSLRINQAVYRLQDLADRDRLVVSPLAALQRHARRLA